MTDDTFADFMAQFRNARISLIRAHDMYRAVFIYEYAERRYFQINVIYDAAHSIIKESYNARGKCDDREHLPIRGSLDEQQRSHVYDRIVADFGYGDVPMTEYAFPAELLAKSAAKID
jgi:hypothetical protein